MSDEISEEKVSNEANQFAKTFFVNMGNGNIDSCFFQFDSQFQNEDLRDFLFLLKDSLKTKSLKNTSIINYSFKKIYGKNPLTNYEIVYEYEYNDIWIYYSFQIQEKNGNMTIYHLNISPYKISLRNVNQFTFQNKGLIHYFFIFMMILVPIFIIISIIFCFKTPLKRKWLWIIFILFGIISFRLNWTNGEFELQLINIRLLGAGFSKSGIVAPWIISFAVPVGAILFWIKRRKINRKFMTELNVESELNENNAP